MEEKVLYNVLKSIRTETGKEYTSAPDEDYLKALETIGLIKLGWDNSLTDFVFSMLSHLENKLF